jgi:hypothetical protein
MSAFMLIRHKVKDFTAWKKGYDAHAPARREAGLTERHLLRSSDDPNEVVLLFAAQDLIRAREFAASDDLRQKMQEVGVIDRPDVFFLND